MEIEYRSGNILDLRHDPDTAIVIPVNCLGVGGAGLAKQWEAVAPYSAADFRNLIRLHRAQPGNIYYLDPMAGEGRFIAATTKGHWRYPSELVWIRSICVDLVGRFELSERFMREGITDTYRRSIALPPLGCGYGGLLWDDVHEIILDVFKDADLQHHRLMIFPPMGS